MNTILPVVVNPCKPPLLILNTITINIAGNQPTQYFRIKLNLERCGSFIINKKLGKNVTNYTFTRSFLLRHSNCKRALRGEVTAKTYRYRVRVEAFNSAGGGPVSSKRFLVKV